MFVVTKLPVSNVYRMNRGRLKAFWTKRTNDVLANFVEVCKCSVLVLKQFFQKTDKRS